MNNFQFTTPLTINNCSYSYIYNDGELRLARYAKNITEYSLCMNNSQNIFNIINLFINMISHNINNFDVVYRQNIIMNLNDFNYFITCIVNNEPIIKNKTDEEHLEDNIILKEKSIIDEILEIK